MAKIDKRFSRRNRVPAFSPVPVRPRADGWPPARQAAFIAALALTRCVRTAAARAGLSRESAYRLRRHPGAASFTAAWDAILHNHGQLPPRKFTPEELARRAHHGLLQPVLWRRKHVATRWKPDNSALLRLLASLSRSRSAATPAPGAIAPFGVNTPRATHEPP